MRHQLVTRLLRWVTVLLAMGLITLRFVHMEADPDTSLSRSRVFYTDEGYNSCNAVNKVVSGHWLCDRNNHILLMPVMPVVQYAVFKVAGLSLPSARLPASLLSVGIILLVLLLLSRRMQEEPQRPPREKWLALTLAVFLLGTNYYFYIYGRLALLDLPMTAFGVASLLAVHKALSQLRGNKGLLWFVVAGVLLAAAFLTKPSAALYGAALVLLMVLQMVVEPGRWRDPLKGMGITLVVAGALILAARVLIGVAAAGYKELTPSHLVTDRIVFHLRTIVRNYVKFFNNPVVKKNAPLLGLAYLNVVVLAFNSARLGVFRLADRVMVALFVACYLFLGFFVHQLPRYFVVLVVPMSYLVATFPDNLRLLWSSRGGALWRGLVIIVVVWANWWNTARLVQYIREPHFSMRTVARQVREIVAEECGADVEGAVLCGDVAATMALSNGMKFSFGVPQHGQRLYLFAQGEAAVPGRTLAPLQTFDLLNNYYCYDYGRRRMYLYRVGN